MFYYCLQVTKKNEIPPFWYCNKIHGGSFFTQKKRMALAVDLPALYEKKIITCGEYTLACRLAHALITIGGIADTEILVIGPANDGRVFLGLVRFRLYCETEDEKIYVTEVPDGEVNNMAAHCYGTSHFDEAVSFIIERHYRYLEEERNRFD